MPVTIGIQSDHDCITCDTRVDLATHPATFEVRQEVVMRDHACSATAAGCPYHQHLIDAEQQLRDAATLTRKLMMQLQVVLDQLADARSGSSYQLRSLEKPPASCSRASAVVYGDGLDQIGCPAVIMALSPRETEVLHWIAAGLSNRQIAERLFLSPRTVERHIANLYLKLDVHNKAEAIDYAQRHGHDSLACPAVR
jgi:DNA-binding CsgD family transcriptional regulator